METVKSFNSELTALYEGKPPISRAKMAQITKSAIKAIKFYKHVVQSVEKFIQKCRPEYKIPGLYVIDSIVRSSRHQYGAEKDVFAPRFSKNIVQTFQHLLKCDPDEKPKLIRVLNLWQKNSVFSPAVIQPLLDLAADPENNDVFQHALNQVQEATGLEPTVFKPKPPKAAVFKEKMNTMPAMTDDKPISMSTDSSSIGQEDDLLKAVSQLLQSSSASEQAAQPPQLSLSAQEAQLQQLQLLQEQLVQQSKLLQVKPAVPQIDSSLLTQIQKLTSQLLGEGSKEDAAVVQQRAAEGSFNKNLLDFDYGESDDDEVKTSPKSQKSNLTGHVEDMLRDEGIMQQIQQVSESIQKTEELKHELDTHRHRILHDDEKVSPPPRHRRKKVEDMDTTPSRYRQDTEVETHRHRRMRDEEVESHRHRKIQDDNDDGDEIDSHRHRRMEEETMDHHRHRRIQEDEVDSHRHRRMHEEYEEMNHRDRDSSFEDLRRPREPPHPPEPAGYPDDSFDGQNSQDASRDFSDYREEREDGEYEEGEYVEDEYVNDSYSNHRDFRERDPHPIDREREDDRHRRGDSSTMDVYSTRHSVSSRRERDMRELPFGPSREYYEKPSRKHRRKDRSRSRSRTPKRKKRSKSRERRSKSREKKSKKERKKRSKSKDRDKERRRREKEREKARRGRGLPPLKENYVAVCSKTLWIGHLNKQTTEDILRKELENYGDVAKISLVLPRGCAFVSLVSRKDAADALKNIKGAKLLGNSLKADWAPGKGIRDSREFNKKFDKDLGVVYISHDKLNHINIRQVADGGIIDEDSLPEHMKTVIDLEESIVIDDDDEVLVVPQKVEKSASKKSKREHKRRKIEVEKVSAEVSPKADVAPPQPEPVAVQPPVVSATLTPVNPIAMVPPLPATSVIPGVTSNTAQVSHPMVPRAVAMSMSTSSLGGIPPTVPEPLVSLSQTKALHTSTKSKHLTGGDGKEAESSQVLDMSMSPASETSPLKLTAPVTSVSASTTISTATPIAAPFNVSIQNTQKNESPSGGEYDPSHPSGETDNDNQFDNNQLLKSVTFPIFPVPTQKLKGNDSDDEGFLPLVRSRNTKKLSIKKQGKFDAPFEGGSVMGKKKSISIVIDRKKSMKADEPDSSNITESKPSIALEQTTEQEYLTIDEDYPDKDEERFDATDINKSKHSNVIHGYKAVNEIVPLSAGSGTSQTISCTASVSQMVTNESSLFNIDISSISVPPVSSNDIKMTTASGSVSGVDTTNIINKTEFLESIALPNSTATNLSFTTTAFPTMIPPPFPTNLFPLGIPHNVDSLLPSEIPPPGQVPFLGQVPLPQTQAPPPSHIPLPNPTSSPSKIPPPTSVPPFIPPPIPPPSFSISQSETSLPSEVQPSSNMNWIPPPPINLPNSFTSNFSQPPPTNTSMVSSSAPPSLAPTGLYSSRELNLESKNAYPPNTSGVGFPNPALQGQGLSIGPGASDVDLRRVQNSGMGYNSPNNGSPFPNKMHNNRPIESQGGSFDPPHSGPFGEIGGDFNSFSNQMGKSTPSNLNSGQLWKSGMGENMELDVEDAKFGRLGRRTRFSSPVPQDKASSEYGDQEDSDSRFRTSGLHNEMMGGPLNHGPGLMGDPLCQIPGPAGGPRNPGPNSFGGRRNSGIGSMGGLGEQGPGGPMGGLRNQGPDGPMGGLRNQGPDGPMGGLRNQGPDGPMGGLRNQGPDGPMGGLRNERHDRPRPQGPNAISSTMNQGPGSMNSGSMGGPMNQGSGQMGGPRNFGPFSMGGPRNLGPGLRNQGPGPMGIQRNLGPSYMGGSLRNEDRGSGQIFDQRGGPRPAGPIDNTFGRQGNSEKFGGMKGLRDQEPGNMGDTYSLGPINVPEGQKDSPYNQCSIHFGDSRMNESQSPKYPGNNSVNMKAPVLGELNDNSIHPNSVSWKPRPGLLGDGGPMGGPRNPGPMGGPINQGPSQMGGPRNPGPGPMGGPMNQGPGPMGGPMNQGPGPMGGPMNQGPGPMGGPRNQGPGPMGGPRNQGPGPMGGPRNQMPSPMGGPINQLPGPRIQGPGPMREPRNQGPGSMGGPRNQGPDTMGGTMIQGPSPMGDPLNQGNCHFGGQRNEGPGPMELPIRQGPGPVGGPIHQGPGPMEGPRNRGPGPMGGPVNQGPGPMGGPRNPGPSQMGGPRNPGPGPMGGPMNQGPGPMGGPRNQGPCPMGGPMNQGPGPMGGPMNPGSGPMGGPMNPGPGPMGGPRNQGPGPMGRPLNQGPGPIEGPRNQGPGAMGGPLLQGPGPMGGPINQGPGSVGGPRNQRPCLIGGPRNQGPGNMGGLRLEGPGPMSGPRFQGQRPIGDPRNQGPNQRNFGPNQFRGPGPIDRQGSLEDVNEQSNFDSPHRLGQGGENFGMNRKGGENFGMNRQGGENFGMNREFGHGPRVSFSSPRPKIPSLLDPDVTKFGSREPPNAGPGFKNSVQGLMSIGPSLTELGVDMEAVKRQSSSQSRDQSIDGESDTYSNNDRTDFQDDFHDQSSFNDKNDNFRDSFRGRSNFRGRGSGYRGFRNRERDSFSDQSSDSYEWKDKPRGKGNSQRGWDKVRSDHSREKSKPDYDIDNWGDDNWSRDNWGEDHETFESNKKSTIKRKSVQDNKEQKGTFKPSVSQASQSVKKVEDGSNKSKTLKTTGDKDTNDSKNTDLKIETDTKGIEKEQPVNSNKNITEDSSSKSTEQLVTTEESVSKLSKTESLGTKPENDTENKSEQSAAVDSQN